MCNPISVTSATEITDSSKQKTSLDAPACPSYHYFTSQTFGADLGFHAEWLRDEP